MKSWRVPSVAAAFELSVSAASWESSNRNVAPISSRGLLTGLNTGTTLVTAIYQGKSGTLQVRVSDRP
jgi:hypothetical protein